MSAAPKTSVVLGSLAKRKPRGRAHRRSITLLISGLQTNTVKRGSIVPKIFLDEELAETDRIVVEGERVWTDEMARLVATEYKDASVEHVSESRTEIYVPVKTEGIVTSSPLIDVAANLSVVVMCVLLLYLYLSQ
jgi:hypothetical protein